jgi:hypothetical protein
MALEPIVVGEYFAAAPTAVAFNLLSFAGFPIDPLTFSEAPYFA